MKRTTFLGVVLVVVTILFFIYVTTKEAEASPTVNEEHEVRGVFVSYIDLENHFEQQSETGVRQEIDQIVQNLKQDGFNLLILQVRSHMDAIYSSSLFPKSSYLEGVDLTQFDPLSYFIEECHASSIQIYAWINPYRIGKVSKEEVSLYPYYDLISDSICEVEDTLYLNPAKEEVTNLLLEGIKEVLQYPVDGILFDDYFYPSMDIDQQEYYSSGMEDVSEFHLQVINQMVQQVYELVHSYQKVFGISPSGNIENNYSSIGADVAAWAREDGYVDFLMPQIYYGFRNVAKPFIETVNEWNALIPNERIPMYIALALYKEDTEDEYAGNGKLEWIEESDILKRQVLLSRNLSNYHGFSFFRYDNAYQGESDEFSNLKELVTTS